MKQTVLSKESEGGRECVRKMFSAFITGSECLAITQVSEEELMGLKKKRLWWAEPLRMLPPRVKSATEESSVSQHLHRCVCEVCVCVSICCIELLI